MRKKFQEWIYEISRKMKLHISKVGGQFGSELLTYTDKIMDWWEKTLDNGRQLLNLIPALVDYRIIIGIVCGVIFSVFAFDADSNAHRIMWTLFAALCHGLVVNTVLEYFGKYPLKDRLVENIKTLYSINDFLIKRKNDTKDDTLKLLYENKITDVNLGIQRWSDQIKVADIAKIKTEIQKIDNSHEANKEVFKIDVSELRDYGISNEIIADFSGTTLENVATIISEHGNLSRTQRRKLSNKRKKSK